MPSSAGYHLYIESLMDNREVSLEERQVIDSTLAAEGDAESLVGAAPLLLSRLSAQVGMLVTPALGDTRLKAVDFVALSGRKVLCVVVSAGGFVESKLIETDELLSRERLVEISNYLTESFAGKTLREVRERLLAMMAEQRQQVDQLLGNAITLAERGLATAHGREVLVQGTWTVLGAPGSPLEPRSACGGCSTSSPTASGSSPCSGSASKARACASSSVRRAT